MKVTFLATAFSIIRYMRWVQLGAGGRPEGAGGS